MKTTAIHEQFTVGGQPDDRELKELGKRFATIVNLRTRQEVDDDATPSAEREKAHSLGLDYVHLPVSPQDLKFSLVDAFRKTVNQSPKPIFVHCASGARAGAFVMMHLAAQHGWSPEETMAQAAKRGWTCDNETLTAFMRDSVSRQNARVAVND